MLLVCDGGVRLVRGRIRERHEGDLVGLGVDAREIAAPGIGDPQHVGGAVDADPARPLRPRERRADVLGRIGVVEFEVGRRDEGHLLLYGRQLPFQRLAGLDVALGDDVERHLGPPDVAVAVTGDAVGGALAAVRGLWRHRLELDEPLLGWVEAQHAVERAGPYAAGAVVVERHRTVDLRHVRWWDVDRDLLGLGIDHGERTARNVRVEPDDALLVADQAMRIRRIAVRRVDLEGLHFAGLGIDATDRHGLVLCRGLHANDGGCRAQTSNEDSQDNVGTRDVLNPKESAADQGRLTHR